MKPFGSVTYCPKCDAYHTYARREYDSGGWTQSTQVEQGRDKEHMVVTCRCGFTWYERPKDFVETVKPKQELTIEEQAKMEVDTIAPEGIV